MGELGINAWGLAVQLVAFIVFIVLFWKYALGPITKCSTSARGGSRRAWLPPTR